MKRAFIQVSGLFVCTLMVCAAGISGGAAYKGAKAGNTGTISGTVRFGGDMGAFPKMKISKDEKWCGPLKPSPRVLGKNGGLANAVISLESVERGKPWTGAGKILLTQAACEFQPHVVLLPAGSTLEIVNDDPILHNVRTTDNTGKTVFNIAQPVKGQRFAVKPERFSRPGMYEVSCDAGHPWMSAHIVVMDHPYYTVTDDEGRFRLDDVPEGTYTMKMWHEGVAVAATRGSSQSYKYEKPYQETRELSVTKNENVIADFLLSPRQAAVTTR